MPIAASISWRGGKTEPPYQTSVRTGNLPAMADDIPFWETKTLEEMTSAEWESLCDGCGRCCLHKLRHEDTGSLSHTNVACRLLDVNTARCSDYANRKRRVPDCITLTPQEVRSVDWLPPSCAYRLLAEDKKLAWWHPLVSGRPGTVDEAGISVSHDAYSEEGISVDDLVDHIWKLPKAKRRAKL